MARKGKFRRELSRYRRLKALITEIEDDSELITFDTMVSSELAVRASARITMFDEHVAKKGESDEP